MTEDARTPAAPPDAPRAEGGSSPGTALLEMQVIEVLKTCFDPEIPVNIYELGLIYEVKVSKEGSVEVSMTLTSPMCPVAGSLPGEVETKIRDVPGVSSVRIDLVWEPPWTPDRMSEAAKLQLGML